MALLLSQLEETESSWSSATTPSTYLDAIAVLAQFAEYKKTRKREWVKERKGLVALYSNIQTKLKTYGLQSWEPKEGLRLDDLERHWKLFLQAEAVRSRAINARIRE